MKRVYKIIIVNILLIAAFIIIGEFIEFRINMIPNGYKYKPIEIFKAFILPYHTSSISFFQSYYRLIDKAALEENYNQEYYMVNYINSLNGWDLEFFRPTRLNSEGGEIFTKNPILLFGCSYAWGWNIEENETFSYKLQDYTKRVIINRAMSGKSVQHMLYMLRNGIDKSISKLIGSNKKPEYIIYTFINDHPRRLYQSCSFLDPRTFFYKYDKSHNLVPKNDFDMLFWHSYILRKLVYYLIPDQKTQAVFLKDHFLASNDEIKKLFPRAKFIIFVYTGDIWIKMIEKDLKKDGIEIVYLSELSEIDFNSDEYRVKNDEHPNEKAWDIIVPLLAKKLNL